MFLAEKTFILSADEVVEAGVVNYIIHVRVYSSLIVEVEESEDVCPLDHDHLADPGIGHVEHRPVLIDVVVIMRFSEENALILRVFLASIDGVEIFIREDGAQPNQDDQHIIIFEKKGRG